MSANPGLCVCLGPWLWPWEHTHAFLSAPLPHASGARGWSLSYPSGQGMVPKVSSPWGRVFVTERPGVCYRIFTFPPTDGSRTRFLTVFTWEHEGASGRKTQGSVSPAQSFQLSSSSSTSPSNVPISCCVSCPGVQLWLLIPATLTVSLSSDGGPVTSILWWSKTQSSASSLSVFLWWAWKQWLWSFLSTGDKTGRELPGRDFIFRLRWTNV